MWGVCDLQITKDKSALLVPVSKCETLSTLGSLDQCKHEGIIAQLHIYITFNLLVLCDSTFPVYNVHVRDIYGANARPERRYAPRIPHNETDPSKNSL